MRTITKTIRLFKFNEASIELRDKIRDNIHYNWNIYSHHMEERIDTLKAFGERIGYKIDYSLSCVPDRGEFISVIFNDNTYDERIDDIIQNFINDSSDCPLTGSYYDEILRYSLKKNFNEINMLQLVFNEYIQSIHDEYEHMLTDEYLVEFCEANNYEFDENGELY